MRPHQRERKQELGDEIAIANRVDAVLADRVEAERLAQRLARHRERRAGDRARAERHRRRTTGRVGQAAPIARERPHMREQPVRDGHGLRALQVRVARHRRVLQPLGAFDQHGL